jgi:hypothetical protein
MENNHKIQQQANNWLICSCGKIFADSRKGKVTKYDKFNKHLLKEELI